VVYKANALSVWLARILVKVKYISLVNLILDQMSITELIQGDANNRNVIKELEAILIGGEKRAKVLSDYEVLHSKLGAGGASKFVASQLLKSLN
jgi:lipid-A-disaccharide synthase